MRGRGLQGIDRRAEREKLVAGSGDAHDRISRCRNER